MSLELLRPAALLGLLLLAPVAWLGLASRRLPRGRRRLATALRLLILALVVLALARPRLQLPAGQRVTVALVDASGSLPADERARAEAFLDAAAERSREDRRLAVVVFGAEARVDRAAAAGPLAPLRSAVDAGATDIAAALRLGAGLLSDEVSGRLLLASDGRANRGDLAAAEALLLARGLPVDVLPLSAGTSGAEAWLARLDAPASARPGQRIELELEVGATAAGPARLQLLREGEPIAERRLQLEPGRRRLRFEDRAERPGPQRYLAILEAEQGGRPENDRVAALTLVAGEPRLALLAGAPERGRALEAALRAAGREVERLAPEALPASPLALSAWDAFLLVDLPASQLPPASQAALQAAVRDLGRGLLMVGGPESFGAGGWRGSPVEEALPVEMWVPADERRPDSALYFLIDRSSSMGEPAAGGDGPGPSKLDLAREALLQAAALLRPEDQLGVLAFDIAARPLWPLQPAGEQPDLEPALLGLTAEGGTSLTAGLSPARRALADVEAARKHAILLSDGWTEAGGLEAARREAARLAGEGVTLSVVAIGEGSAPELAEVAALGGGRYLPAEDAAELPRIFVEETQLALGSFLVEQVFQPRPLAPSAILAGLDAGALPALGGYNAVTARPSATVVLQSPLEDPILAQWQLGLGRAAAWTSDLDARWSEAWLDWPELGRFAAQLADWLLPPPEQDGLEIALDTQGRRVAVVVTASEPGASLGDGGTDPSSEDGSAGRVPSPETAGAEDAVGTSAAAVESLELRFLGPDGGVLDLTLERTGLRRFEGDLELPLAGVWLLRATGRDAVGRVRAARTAGLVLPEAPEYAELAEEPTDPRLAALAQATGGRLLDAARPQAVFDPVPGATSGRELWPWLLTLATLLWPLDVALRRVGWGRALGELGRRGRAGAGRDPVSPASPAAGRPASRAASGGGAGSRAPGEAGDAPAASDYLDRLRAARDRDRGSAQDEDDASAR